VTEFLGPNLQSNISSLNFARVAPKIIVILMVKLVFNYTK
jgi:hypothetical protein